MTVRVTVTSPDLEEQIKKLQLTDKLIEKHFYQAMRKATELTYQNIAPNVPIGRTGRAASSFRRGVFGWGKSMVGLVGWYGDAGAWYINIVESGARKHSLLGGKGGNQKGRARREEKLNARISRGRGLPYAHVMINGRWVSMAVHPGFSKRGFLASGFAASKPVVEAEFQKASDAALAEQVVR